MKHKHMEKLAALASRWQCGYLVVSADFAALSATFAVKVF